MTTPRFREDPVIRAECLNLGKMHIAWCKRSGEWRAYGPGHHADEAVEFAIDQDQRWTPRMRRD